MKIAYIDFDGTLYATSKLKFFIVKQISLKIFQQTNLDYETILNSVSEEFKNRKEIGIFDFARQMAKKYDANQEIVCDEVKEILKNGSEFLYNDSTEFLKKLRANGYETCILTYSGFYNYDFQMLKLMGSGANKFADGFLICSKNKGELNLDYRNGIFVDDNPDQLESLFNAGVSEDRLIRIKRKSEKYSSHKITAFSPREYDTLENIEV